MDRETKDPAEAQNPASNANQSLREQEMLEFYNKLLTMMGESVDHLMDAVFDVFADVDLPDIEQIHIEQLLAELELISDLPLSLKDKEKLLKKLNEKRLQEEKQNRASHRRKRSLHFHKKAPADSKTNKNTKDPALKRRQKLAKLLQQQLLLRDPNTLKSMLSTLKNQKLTGFYKQLSPNQKMQLLKNFANMPKDAFIQQAKQDHKQLMDQNNKQNAAATAAANKNAADPNNPFTQANAAIQSNLNDPNNLINIANSNRIIDAQEIMTEQVMDLQQDNIITEEVHEEIEEKTEHMELVNILKDEIMQTFMEEKWTQLPITNSTPNEPNCVFRC